MTDQIFSKRYGLRQTQGVEIIVRHEAPYDLRGVLVEIAYDCGFTPKSLRALVCRILRTRPDPNNWSEYPNIDEEVRGLLDDCEWYRFYDVVEALAHRMSETPFSYDPEKFESEVNEYFIENGIGWLLKDGRLEIRGPESFQKQVENAKISLKMADKNMAMQEFHEALLDLSRRPEPDVSGAIQHAMAALECVAREVTGNHKATLGEIIKHQSLPIPKPLDKGLEKFWGFASEHARHIREGRPASYEEAELMVGVCASVSAYLIKKK